MTFFIIKDIYFYNAEYPEKQYNTHHKHIWMTGAKALHGLLSYVSVMFSYLEQQVHSACVRRPPDSVIWAVEGQGWSVQSAVEQHSVAEDFVESPAASAGIVAANAGTPTGLLKQCYLKDPVPLQ
jgi:hypothetical protein